MFLDAVDAIIVDALARIGNDPKARYLSFLRLLAAVQDVIRGGECDGAR